MFILLLSLVSFAFAGPDRFEIQNLIKSTVAHDNTFCMLGGVRVEFVLRGLNKKTDLTDRVFGEHIFFRKKKNLQALPLNKDNLHSYRFFPSKNGKCSKSLAFTMDKNTSAVLFLRENRPYKGKLVIQLYDHINHLPKEAIETEYSSEEVMEEKDGFAFKVMPERHDMIMGQIMINDIKYTYQDRDFHPWMHYTLKGFETLGSTTFNNFEWKKFFKDEADFFQMTGWNQATKQFSNTYIYIAVNHVLKKECLFISSSKVQITGSEAWHCL